MLFQGYPLKSRSVFKKMLCLLYIRGNVVSDIGQAQVLTLSVMPDPRVV